MTKHPNNNNAYALETDAEKSPFLYNSTQNNIQLWLSIHDWKEGRKHLVILVSLSNIQGQLVMVGSLFKVHLGNTWQHMSLRQGAIAHSGSQPSRWPWYVVINEAYHAYNAYHAYLLSSRGAFHSFLCNVGITDMYEFSTEDFAVETLSSRRQGKWF